MHKAIGPLTVTVLKDNTRLNSAFILDNGFFTGSDAKTKLTDMTASRVIGLLSSELQGGVAWTAARFKSELCRPAKKAEAWCKQMISKFGALASDSPFFLRVKEGLFTVAGLQKVLGTMGMDAENLPLHGTSDQNPGIEECRKVVQELLKLKHPQEEQPKQQQDDITVIYCLAYL